MDEEMKNIYGLGCVPVLTGSAAERFTEICENNASNLSGIQYSKEREDWVKTILAKRRK